MPVVSNTAVGVSPQFIISAEEFLLRYRTAVTRVPVDGVHPPLLGAGGLASVAHLLVNQWSPWIDDKLVPPRYDGVCRYTGVPSNKPGHIKDFHQIALYRAVDYILAPRYLGRIVVHVGTVIPLPPPTP